MRIAIFTNNYLPNPYGVSTSIETFRRELESRGHTVYIFAPRWPGYVDKNPNVFRYPSLDIEIKFRFPLAIPFSWKMSKILKNLDLDIIHSQHPNLLGSAARRWAKKKNIPLVFTWHTLYDHYAHFAGVIPEKIAVGYMVKKATKYADQADAVVVPTDSIIPILRKWGVKNKTIVPVATGVEESAFANPDGKKIREKYGIGSDEIVLFLVSRLTTEKNMEFLFRSLVSILQKDGRIKFVICGDGDLKPKLKDFCQKENIEKQVIFAGVVSRKEIKNYFAAGDIFVYASKSETQGMIVTEAMYSGLPIVAVDATGSKSLILNNGNGYLVKENEEEFSEAVFKLIEDENLRKKFGEVSKKIAKSFTSSVCAEKLLSVYGEAIRKNKEARIFR